MRASFVASTPEPPSDYNWVDEYKKLNKGANATKRFMEFLDSHAKGTEERIAERLEEFYEDYKHKKDSPVKKVVLASSTFLHGLTQASSKNGSNRG